MRDLEQLREREEDGKASRGLTFSIVILSGAAVVFGALAISGQHSSAHVAPVDPLGELVAMHGKVSAPAASAGPKASDLTPHDVTFPGMLSDQEKPTTALALVRSSPSAAAVIPPPPPATDKLPVVPLPAQNVLQASPMVTRPRDSLTKAATDSSQQAVSSVPSSAAGHAGGYQLQVSSFQSAPEAHQFAAQLRARGHKAHVVEAHVTGRGLWYRVQIGPFPTQKAAATYRSGFEAKEHVVPFVVPPTPTSDTH